MESEVESNLNVFKLEGPFNENSNVFVGDEDVFSCCERFDMLLQDKEWQKINEVVGVLTSAFLTLHNRKNVTTEALNKLSKVLEVLVSEFKADNHEVTEAITETLRALRNCCVGEPKNQKTIVEVTSCVQNTSSILISLSALQIRKENVTCLRVGTQFLGNLVVNNKETQPLIWNQCSKILIDLLKYEDDKVANYSSMVIYNILLGCPDIASVVEDYKELLGILIDHAMKDSEFALFTVELLLSRPRYLPKVYGKVSVVHRLFLLDSLHSMITSESKTPIPISSLEFLSEQFKDNSDLILKTCNKYVENLEPVEVSKLLQLLASACADTEYRMELQRDKALLITCSMLLSSMHRLGKAGENHFSVIQKMADLSLSSANNDILEHPAFGFKSCLVQMLGNLCWRNTDNQNQLRELDCIPILLDCCNIDARNPLIIQWVVLAIRNLCEDNRHNQSVIAAMTQEGVVDSKVLQEIGITLHAENDNKIVIAPLEKKPPSDHLG